MQDVFNVCKGFFFLVFVIKYMFYFVGSSQIEREVINI